MKVITKYGEFELVRFLDRYAKKTTTKPSTRVAFAVVVHSDGTEGVVARPEVKNWNTLPNILPQK